MARKKDLAGLAALAGLAYMANRDKGGEAAPAALTGGRASDSDAMDAMTSGEYGGPNRGGDIMTDKEDWGSSASSAPASRPRRPAAASSKPRTSPATPPANPDYGNESRRPEAAKPALKYQSLQDRARAYEEERARSGAGGMYGTPASVKREPLPTAEDAAYMKKGGKVKGWGSARGARKAKIY